MKSTLSPKPKLKKAEVSSPITKTELKLKSRVPSFNALNGKGFPIDAQKILEDDTEGTQYGDDAKGSRDKHNPNFSIENFGKQKQDESIY